MKSNTEMIWYDGRLVPYANATTHVLTHSLHYGVSAIEGIRAYTCADNRSCVFRLDDHLHRLLNTAKSFRMPITYTHETLREAHLDVLRANALSQAYLRPIVFYGAEKRGLLPHGLAVHVAISAFEWEEYLGTNAAQGIRVRTATYTRPSPGSMLTRSKLAAAYAVSMLAKLEATSDGYDEALLLDPQGYVAEGSAENVFIVKRGELIDPNSPCALQGLTRDTVLTLAHDRKIPVVSRPVTRDDVYHADEAFFTGTAAEVVPIVELDGRRIGTGKPGPITSELACAYTDTVHGRDSAHSDWLTPLN